MWSKTSIAILAATAIFGAASAAQASGSKNDAGSHGGFDIGPLGQCFVPPDCDADQGGPYVYARPPSGYVRGWHYTPGYGWHYGRP